MDNVNQSVPMFRPIEAPEEEPILDAIPLEPLPGTEEVDVFWILNAQIEEIRNNAGATNVIISYQDANTSTTSQMKRLNLEITPTQTRLYNPGKEVLLIDDLSEGTFIDVLVSSRMLQGNVPIAKAYQVLVVEEPISRDVTMGNIVQVNPTNDYFLIAPSNSPDRILRVNVEADTVILDARGRRIYLHELLPDMPIRVEHESFFTASIPPQTTGYLIRVM